MTKSDKNGHNNTIWLGSLLLILCLIMLIYKPVVQYDFLLMDDPLYINSHTKQGFRLSTLQWAFTNWDAYNWQPMTWLSHLLDIELFGLWAGGHHLTNVIFHGLNAVLLAILLRYLTQQPLLSLSVAVLFAIHPLRVESVVWVAERKDVLSLFWGLLSLWGYAHYTRAANQVWRWSWYSIAFIMLLLGLMSKAMLVTWPALFLLLDYWPLARMQARLSAQWWPLVREKIPFFIMVMVFSWITLQAQGIAVIPVESYPLWARIETSLLAYATYLYKTFLPYHLAIHYPHTSIQASTWVTVTILISLLLISIAVIVRARQMAYAFVGWYWFLGTLVPVIGLVQVGEQFMADRYVYIPQIGLIILMVWGVHDALQKGLVRRMWLISGTLLAITGLSVIAARQVNYWRSDITLFSHAVAVVPNNYPAHIFLGIAWYRQQQWSLAEAHLLKAWQIAPQYFSALYLAKIAEQQQQPEKVLYYYQQALKWVPDYAIANRIEVLTHYAQYLSAQKQPAQARLQWEAILKLQPQHAQALEALSRFAH